MVSRWREGILVVMASGFIWYLFVAPQEGSAAVDTQLKDFVTQGRVDLQTNADLAIQKLRDLIVH